MIEDLHLPISIEEECEDTQSDNKYESAINYLRVYVNAHRNEFPRVYQELKKYNFWRNLYGGKWVIMLIYLILILFEVSRIDQFSIMNMSIDQFPIYIALFAMMICSTLFCAIVTKKTVKRNAFDYSKTLLETIELIHQK